MFNINNGQGVLDHAAGAVWPYRLITGIFERILSRYPERLSIETNTPATHIEHIAEQKGVSGHAYIVKTPRGIIRAKQVVHCTNANAAHLLRPLIGRLYPYRGTMSVQKPGPHLEKRGNERT